MTQGQHRQKSDRYAEQAIARLVNECSEQGFVLTRLPGPNSPWIVTTGAALMQHVGATITEAVEKALNP
jgi:hypothetical protein